MGQTKGIACLIARRRRLGVLLALGLSAYAAPARATDFNVHGLLDLVGAERGRAYELNLLTRLDAPFDAVSVRVMADATVNDRMTVFTQVVLRDESLFYLDGAYLMYTPSAARDFHVLAGKVPWLVGTWAPRTYSNKNPLIGEPLMYQYHSTLVWYALPPNANALLRTKGQGQYGVNYYGTPMSMGMPLVDDSYWDVGITVTGSARPLEYAVGMTAGTPGWGSTAQDENSGKTALARVGVEPLPGVRIGVSGAYGPYLKDAVNPKLPQGRDSNDYHQKIGMADAEILIGHLELRGEGALNRWQSPNVGDLDVASGYGEVKYSFSFGGYVAGRFDVMSFGDITDSAGNRRSWDANMRRGEAGIGWRFDRSTIAKLVYQRSTMDLESGDDREPALVAAQLSVAF
jgi:hypothetical protein